MMKNRNKILASLLASGFVVFLTLTPHVARASIGTSLAGFVGITAIDIVGLVLAPLIVQCLAIASLLVYVTGAMLNYTLYETIILMAKNLGTQAGGFGTTINAVWTAVRDVANMLFIFALLYTAILTIFGKGDYKRTILNLIIAALLINFSLFFTKVIIDVANYLALVFYDAVVPGVTNAGLTNAGSFFGLSNTFVSKMGLPLLFDATNLKTFFNGALVAQGILGTVVLIIVAFIFFFVTIMFIVRYVVLILVMILSPLMFVSLIIPKGVGGGGYTKKWWDALIGQAFFAPAYFFMTWIVLKVIDGILNAQGLIDGQGNSTFDWSVGLANTVAGTNNAAQTVNIAANTDLVTTVFNFIIIIAFLIASLVIARSVANKAGGGVSAISKWAGGFAGAATIGLTGKYARGTLGRGAAAFADNKVLLESANKGNRLARLALATAEKTSKSSLDIRGTGLGGTLGAGKAQSGGFAADLKSKQKLAEDRAKRMGATQEEKDQHKNILDSMDKAHKDAEETLDKAKARAEANAGTIVAMTPGLTDALREEQKAKDRMDGAIRTGMPKSQVDQFTQEYKDAQTVTQKERKIYDDLKDKYVEAATVRAKGIVKDVADERDRIKALGNEGEQRMNRAAKYREDKVKRMNSRLGVSFDRVGLFGKAKREESDSAKALRKAAKGKTTDEELAELARKKQKEVDDAAAAATPSGGGGGATAGGGGGGASGGGATAGGATTP